MKIKIQFWHDNFNIYGIFRIFRVSNFVKIWKSEYSAFHRSYVHFWTQNIGFWPQYECVRPQNKCFWRQNICTFLASKHTFLASPVLQLIFLHFSDIFDICWIYRIFCVSNFAKIQKSEYSAFCRAFFTTSTCWTFLFNEQSSRVARPKRIKNAKFGYNL